jgi:hypothetical protein
VTIFRFEDGDAAIEHGARQRIVARNGDSVILINVWESAEGSDAMAQDPRVLAVLSEMGFDGPPANRELFELVDVVTAADAASATWSAAAAARPLTR